LWAHAVDAFAAAEWLWWRGLAPSARRLLSVCLAGGEDEACLLLCWLACLHDLGKASPAFQVQEAVRASVTRGRFPGLPVRLAGRGEAPHAMVSAAATVRLLKGAGWSQREAVWPAVLLGGHHGRFPDTRFVSQAQGRPDLYGDPEWDQARSQLAQLLAERLGVADRLAGWRVLRLPAPVQLALAGWVVLADWLASSEPLLGDDAGELDGYLPQARERADAAAKAAGWGRLWTPVTAGRDVGGLFAARFPGKKPLPLQASAAELAWRVPRPGLFVVEAPTGQGKTELALTIAEITAVRFGARGLFVGLPTQATANGIFSRTVDWLAHAGGGGIRLAHGNARWNPQFTDLLKGPGLHGVGDCGDVASAVEASSWYLGRHRALWESVVVGTVDQLLLAATPTRFVSVRFASLVGKIVVLDEVHAVDVFSSVFLRRALSWLGAAGVPVVLLSATLPAAARQALAEAYAGGPVDLPEQVSYPGVLAVLPPLPGAAAATESARDVGTVDPRPVRIGWLDEPPAVVPAAGEEDQFDDQEGLAGLLRERLAGDGCALVIRNTVRRAQRTYRAMVRAFGVERVMLVHARFTVADRRRLDGKLLEWFGPRGDRPTGEPFVVVATQVAEQSLDIDLDLLVSDLAPIDLLIQRLGRTHRHAQAVPRPARVAEPWLIIAGLRRCGDEAVPEVPSGSVRVYGKHLLWRTAAVLAGAEVRDIAREGPTLVDAVYGEAPLGPAVWQEALAEARVAFEAARQRREEAAKDCLLAPVEQITGHGHLGFLHVREQGTAAEDDDPRMTSQVRDGDPSIEVLLLHRGEDGLTLPLPDGRPVPIDSPPPDDLLEALLEQAIRLPAELTHVAERECPAPAGWKEHPWLRRRRLLALPASGTARFTGRHAITYDAALGLEVRDA
jgi:CRISPR-associated endonuclease Cas3-HD